jgi:hypothetical protein
MITEHTDYVTAEPKQDKNKAQQQAPTTQGQTNESEQETEHPTRQREGERENTITQKIKKTR